MNSQFHTYRDVSDDADARQRASNTPLWRQAVLDRGFTPVGLLEKRLTHHAATTESNPPDAPLEAELLVDVPKHGYLAEVLSSADNTAFAYIERHGSVPLLCFRTITRDGLVVETVMQPLPEHRELLPSNHHRPQAGYYVQYVATSDPVTLWQTHRKHLAQLPADQQENLCQHDSL
ncbi:MAG: hypothetical protein HC837_18935, partial [Chloroflexaceae bacterium]|nr:hypothetical protein [Chloroflexaceae bacterium]